MGTVISLTTIPKPSDIETHLAQFTGDECVICEKEIPDFTTPPPGRYGGVGECWECGCYDNFGAASEESLVRQTLRDLLRRGCRTCGATPAKVAARWGYARA